MNKDITVSQEEVEVFKPITITLGSKRDSIYFQNLLNESRESIKLNGNYKLHDSDRGFLKDLILNINQYL